MISQTVHIRDILGHRQRISEKMCPTSAPERAHRGRKGAEIHLFPLTFPIEFLYREIYPKIVYLCPTCALFGPRRCIGSVCRSNRGNDHKVGGRGKSPAERHHGRLRGTLGDGGGPLLYAGHDRTPIEQKNTVDGPMYRRWGESRSERHHGRLRGIVGGWWR